MQEYVFNKKLSKKLYKAKRKNYTRYWIGSACITVLLVIMLGFNIFIQVHAEDHRQSIEGLVVGLPVDIILFIGIALFWALASSGGYEMLRNSEECWFDDQKKEFCIEYEPQHGGVPVKESIEYKDINYIDKYYQYGKFSIRNRQKYEDGPYKELILYGHYDDMEEIVSRLMYIRDTENPERGSV